MLKSKIKNQSGMAAMEIVAIMMVIMILFNFSLGFFGVIHTGILKGLAARNYAFETFRFRSNLDFFCRENDTRVSKFRIYGNRFHGVTSENNPSNADWVATARPISFVSTLGGTDADGNDYSRTPASDTNVTLHNNTIFNIRDDGKPLLDQKDIYRTFPVWIRPLYGICINSECKPVP